MNESDPRSDRSDPQIYDFHIFLTINVMYKLFWIFSFVHEKM